MSSRKFVQKIYILMLFMVSYKEEGPKYKSGYASLVQSASVL